MVWSWKIPHCSVCEESLRLYTGVIILADRLIGKRCLHLLLPTIGSVVRSSTLPVPAVRWQLPDIWLRIISLGLDFYISSLHCAPRVSDSSRACLGWVLLESTCSASLLAGDARCENGNVSCPGSIQLFGTSIRVHGVSRAIICISHVRAVPGKGVLRSESNNSSNTRWSTPGCTSCFVQLIRNSNDGNLCRICLSLPTLSQLERHHDPRPTV